MSTWKPRLRHRIRWWFERRFGIFTSDEFRALHYGYPPALAKACCDSFDYALGLKTGQIIYFDEAEPRGRRWVHLDGVKSYGHIKPNADARDEGWVTGRDGKRYEGALFDRGVDVAIDAIAWVADAPHGS